MNSFGVYQTSAPSTSVTEYILVDGGDRFICNFSLLPSFVKKAKIKQSMSSEQKVPCGSGVSSFDARANGQAVWKECDNLEDHLEDNLEDKIWHVYLPWCNRNLLACINGAASLHVNLPS